MTATESSASGGSFGVVAVLAILVGAIVLGYGFLIVPVSMVGGIHFVATGLSVALSGLFATEWAGTRFGISVHDRRRLSLTFAAVAGILLLVFLVLNYAAFGAEEIDTGVAFDR